MNEALQEKIPLTSHGQWQPAADRPDPLFLLQAQDEGRLQHLLPVKYGRMVESPFAFLRGSAVVMAADLEHTLVSGIQTVLCGDAHLNNFGVYASPERRLVFDINDFDEVFPGPWEWDIKRLAASAVVAGRANGFEENDARAAAVTAGNAYRKAMKLFSTMPSLEVWYYYVEAKKVKEYLSKSSKKARKSAKQMIKKARKKTNIQTLKKLTHIESGKRQISGDGPLLVPLRDMDLEQIYGKEVFQQFSQEAALRAWSEYIDSLPEDRRVLLSRYHPTDVALRAGGVGSVGTHCSILLLEGQFEEDALILQLKQAGPSALEAYLPHAAARSPAERVVYGQRIMQSVSDIFLGHHVSKITGNEFYWRQLKDMKGSVEVESLDEDGFASYLAVCAFCLAHAHARASRPSEIRDYLGESDAFDEALGDFAVAYADQTERDHAALVEAIDSGRIEATPGV